MASEALTKLVRDLEKERDTWCTEFDANYRNHSRWLAEATESGKRRIYEAEPSFNKKTKSSNGSGVKENENACPNITLPPPGEDSGVINYYHSATSLPLDAVKSPELAKSNLSFDIEGMKVQDLKKELRVRGLATNGLKRDLQQRLESALLTSQLSVLHSKSKNLPKQEEDSATLCGNNKHNPHDIDTTRSLDDSPCMVDVEFMEIDTANPTGHVVLSSTASVGKGNVDVPVNNAARSLPEILNCAGRQSLSAVVTQEMSNLAVGSESSPSDAAPIDCVIQQEQKSQRQLGRMKDGHAAKEEFELDSVSCSTTDDFSVMSPKKKTKLAAVLKATVKMFSPKRKKEQNSPRVELLSKSSENTSSAGSEKEIQSQINTSELLENETFSAIASVTRTVGPKSGELSNATVDFSTKEMTTTERCGGGKSTSVEPLLFFSSAESRNKDMASNIKTEDGRHTQQDIKNAATDVLKSKESVKSQVQFKASGSNDATSRSAEERRADKERQRARLAEMRGKMRAQAKMELAKSNPSTSVRPIADYSQKIARPQTVNPVTSSDSSLIKPQPLINESESKIATNAAVMEEKRRILAAQMREQAVAEAKSAQLVLAVDEKTLKPEALLQDFLVAPLNAPCNNNIDHKPKATNASSPMETYEMSDKEDADSSVEESSDSEEDDNDVQPRKKVPTWAQKNNIIKALEKQFSTDHAKKADPDVIFGEVRTCNLEEIFDQKKLRYQRRTSSGNWNQDRVTVMEKLTYKRTMGYNG